MPVTGQNGLGVHPRPLAGARSALVLLLLINLFNYIDRQLGTLSPQGNARTSLIAPNAGTTSTNQPCYQNQFNATKMGSQTTVIPSDNDADTNWGNTSPILYRNTLVNYFNNLNYTAITAEMQIQGDPFFDKPIFIQTFNLSVVVLQPFRLALGCKWQGGACNRILTNCKWWISGMSHQIGVGSFTTTLKMLLVPPLDNPTNVSALTCS